MKLIYIMFLGLATTSLLAQEQSTSFCLKTEVLERVQKKVVNLLESRQQTYDSLNDKNALIRLMKHFQEASLRDYLKAISYFKKDDLSCEDITTWSMIELYLDHEPLRSIYIIVETKDEEYFVVNFDCGLQKGHYLGKMKQDYFSKMLSFMLPNIKGRTGSDYIMYARFSNEKVLEVDIATDVNLWTINQIALLELMLF